MERQREDENNDNSWGWGAVFGALALAAGAGMVAGAIAVENEREKRKKIEQDNRTAALDSSNEQEIDSSLMTRVLDDDIDFEYDYVERSAEVYLYTSAIEDFPHAVTAKYHHWEIVVIFEDQAFRSLDGYGDASGRMRGRYKKVVQTTVCVHKMKLGDVTISPRKLWQYAKNNVLNHTPFNFAENNCQNWALTLAKQLGVNVFEKIHKIERLSSGMVVIGGMCSALFSSFTGSSKRSS